MRILVIGGGGREHALVWKIYQSPLVTAVYCAPGNPGITQLAKCVDIAANDVDGLLAFAVDNRIDLTVVGPEDPLVLGIVDAFEAQGLKIFGPSAKAAELEGSKVFTKYLLDKYKIPTADCVVLEEPDEAFKYIEEIDYPTVVKADGLAAGKGSIICESPDEARDAIHRIMIERCFGDAGGKVIVEEFMRGEEASVLGISDGSDLRYFAPAQDHKAIFDHDKGPNTGGMGAYAPAPIVDEKMLARVRTEVMEPTIQAMALEKRPYRGVLYSGLMITPSGPRVIEFNCRFGDPEAQVILPLYSGDLVELMFRVASGKKVQPGYQPADKWAMCVVLASGGYPDKYEKNKEIFGLDRKFEDDVMVFHAGTRQKDRKTVSAGGRVLGVTAVGDSFHDTRNKAYSAVQKITFDRAYYRKDIGAKALSHLGKNKKSDRKGAAK